MILIDSNVLIDVMGKDAGDDWSGRKLAEVTDSDAIAINPIIFAEISAGYESFAKLEEALALFDLRRESLPYDAAFVAGRAFVEYRRRGGVRRSPLPDFYIGAHAAVAGMTLLTRDARVYRTYFPKLKLIAPA